jgi:hypothetical protein
VANAPFSVTALFNLRTHAQSTPYSTPSAKTLAAVCYAEITMGAMRPNKQKTRVKPLKTAHVKRKRNPGKPQPKK